MLSLKKFLDETAQNIGNLPADQVESLFSQLVEQRVLSETCKDLSDEEIEEILKFCSASVLEITKTSRLSLMNLLKNSGKLRKYPNYHVLVNAITSNLVKEPISVALETGWIDSILDALISGLTTIESETISLSGSSLIKLLKWERTNEVSWISRKLADHEDFVAILTADMCAMFARMEEEGDGFTAAPFIRIVRYCELVIDVSDPKSGLKDSIIKTVQEEFISKVYRTTLKESKEKIEKPLRWCNELLKTCHRGNELVRPLVNEVFHKIKPALVVDNAHFIEIVANERSRPIDGIVKLLFTAEDSGCGCCTIKVPELMNTLVIDDLIYKKCLKEQLESFEQFRISRNIKISGLTPLAVNLFNGNRTVLLNWLPYCVKTCRILPVDLEMKMFVDISTKIVEFLEL